MTDYFNDVNPTFPHSMMYEGSLYQICTACNAANIFINKKLFRDNDIEYPAVDWTSDDFYNIAKKITKKSGGKTEIYGYGWTNRLWGSWMPWIFNNDTNLYTESEAPNSEFSDWFWKNFYGADPKAAKYQGGPRWQKPQVFCFPPGTGIHTAIDCSPCPTVRQQCRSGGAFHDPANTRISMRAIQLSKYH